MGSCSLVWSGSICVVASAAFVTGERQEKALEEVLPGCVLWFHPIHSWLRHAIGPKSAAGSTSSRPGRSRNLVLITLQAVSHYMLHLQ